MENKRHESRAKLYGMRYPSIDDLLEVVDSKYKLVIASSKRAKEISDGANLLVKTECYLPVGQALEEIYAGKVKVVDDGTENYSDK